MNIDDSIQWNFFLLFTVSTNKQTSDFVVICGCFMRELRLRRIAMGFGKAKQRQGDIRNVL